MSMINAYDPAKAADVAVRSGLNGRQRDVAAPSDNRALEVRWSTGWVC